LVKVNFKKFKYSELKKLLGTGFYFTIGSISTIFLVKIDSFIIGRELGLEVVGYFYITVKIFLLFQKVCNVFLNNFRPHISQLYAKSQIKSIDFIFQFLNQKLLVFTLFFSALLMILNKYFIEFWVGKEFYLGSEFSILFGFAIVLDILTIPSRIVLTSSLFDIKYISYFRLSEAGFRCFGILFFYQYFGLNIMPIMSIISSILFGHLFFHFKLKKYFNVNFINSGKSNFTILFSLTTIILFLYTINEIDYFIYCILLLSITLILRKLHNFIGEFKKLKFLLK
jgi:O-antigen/teichoic acid export membrane protein